MSARGRVCATCRRTRTRTASRDQRLQDTYGITEAEYQAILDMQDGKCAICRGERRGNLDVDHDHALERQGLPIRETIRGLLCRRCNRRLLPSCRDNIEVLKSAMAYLAASQRLRVQALLAVGG